VVPLALAVLVAGAAGCTEDVAPPSATGPDPTVTTEPAAGGTDDGPAGRYELRELARLDQPTSVAAAAGSDVLFVAERPGRVWALHPDGDGMAPGPAPVLDLSDRVSSGPEEQGLLGLAVLPDPARLAVSYVGTDQRAHVVAYPLDGDRVDPASGRELLAEPIPAGNTHGGGGLAVGPDGALYVGLGDNRGGASAGTWARILRIDPASGATTPWVTGVRNPWRFGFDGPTNSLWVADVGGDIGGDRTERIYRLPADRPTAVGPEVPPHTTYDADSGGCAVIGGVVYRGGALADLRGRYVFSDFCRGLLSVDPDRPGLIEPLGVGVAAPSTVGTDAAGEPVVTGLGGPVARLGPTSR
jgi:glucose/arabinose dehydrogenase